MVAMGPSTIFWFYIAVTLRSTNCETKISGNDGKVQLPELLSEQDLSSLEASQEDIDNLNKIVKRLAPEKNVFFGNEELLNEWLQGAGMGQPGVDFPMLTNIPATSFSCRSRKGGYYADLDTHCQVFHICDNGRKISFLCPNGTIFQQSQLICDWWFKVDCSKSTELYEASAEQLAEDERKRADLKRMNSEFHRSSSNDNSPFYQSNYDGKQNGRTNPYGSASKNQLPGTDQRHGDPKNSKPFDPNQIYNQQNTGSNNQFNQINDLASGGAFVTTSENLSVNKPSERSANLNTRNGNYQDSRQQNQLVEDRNGKFNYDQRGSNKYSAHVYQERDNYYTTTSIREVPSPRGSKSRTIIAKDEERVTPIYTETTTFRTSTLSPIKEYQQPAETAAFVSQRSRLNKAYSTNQFNIFNNNNNNNNNDNSNNHRGTNPRKISTPGKSTSPEIPQNILKPKEQIPDFPFPTFSPIYKPRTTTPEQTTLTTSGVYSNTDYYGQNIQDRTTNFDQQTTTPYVTSQDFRTPRQDFRTTNQDFRTTTQPPFTGDVTRSYRGSTPSASSYTERAETTTTEFAEPTTSSLVTPRTYGNSETYSDAENTLGTGEFSRTTYTTARAFADTQKVGQTSGTATQPIVQYQENRKLNSFDQNSIGTTRSQDLRDEKLSQVRGPVKSTVRTSSSFRQNVISPSTEKSVRQTQASSNLNQQRDLSGAKTVRPYDTSITYQNGKYLSTLGPYIPFTKNYAYSTTSTTTQKPPTYTATVPTVSGNLKYRTGSKISGRIQNVTPSSFSKFKGSSTYLPEVRPNQQDQQLYSQKRITTTERPFLERQHALNMLQSLKGLEGTMPTIIRNGSRGGLTIPHSSSPATLHSLALYFATNSEELNDSKQTQTGSEAEDLESSQETLLENNKSLGKNNTVELPTSILTQHTINSYAELFNLNNALDTNANSTLSGKGEEEKDGEEGEDSNDDLDIQQSEGPLNGAKKSNSTKLRELAQVFTHALSAYLQDPDTFKKILTEIRPTEPALSISNEDDDGITTTTENYSTTSEDYPSVTKEKDEVLDFSEDVGGPRRGRPTTMTPTTTEIPTTTDDAAFGYYTTSLSYSDSNYQTTTLASIDNTRDYLNPPQNPANDFASQVNQAFDVPNGNEIQSFNGPSGPSGPTSNDALNEEDNYFPSADSGEQNQVDEISRNSTTYQPYGKYVKPPDAEPIGDNYVASSTPATYEQTFAPNNYENSNGISESQRDEPTTTVEPFRIRYYDTTTTKSQENSGESLVTANSIYSHYNNFNRVSTLQGTAEKPYFNINTQAPSQPTNPITKTHENDRLKNENYEVPNPSSSSQDTDDKINNHWTSSPAVTQLWESTVFVDPKRINQELTSETLSQTTSLENFGNDPSATTHSSIAGDQELLVTDATSGVTPRNSNRNGNNKNGNNLGASTPWQWAGNDNDAPTAFTLLPTVYATEHTATPAPTYTTRSSITTTITSSVTSTNNLPQESIYSITKTTSTRLKNSIMGNTTENEIIRAKEMFGNLNDSSSATLMKVMKTADQNATVRQLILLLVSHCSGPMDKTKEDEKEELLNALLKMPVHEFTSDESRDLIEGINRVNLPIRNGDLETRASSPLPTSTEPAVTTFRSKKLRRVKMNTDESSVGSRVNGKGEVREVVDETTASDGRALELLRSLYTIAAKWG